MGALGGVVIFLMLVLAAANGANDVSKGIATLAGAGVARYRVAIVWGTGTTFVGAIASGVLADRLSVLFSRGIVTAPPSVSFAVAVLAGSTAWVGIATALRAPVSTTHAIIGALIGAGIQLAPGAVNWGVLLTSVVGPLMASIGAAYAASTTLPLLAVSRCGRADNCTQAAGRVRMTMTAAHWLTSGATGLARGLNDTPKIVAIGALVLVPTGSDASQLVGAVAVAMAIGGLVAGMRVSRSLGEKVVRMDHAEGFRANLATAVLVGIGAHLGLPMSTTHVATGAIAGQARGDFVRLNRRTLRGFALAWTVTPVTAGLIATLTFRLLS